MSKTDSGLNPTVEAYCGLWRVPFRTFSNYIMGLKTFVYPPIQYVQLAYITLSLYPDVSLCLKAAIYFARVNSDIQEDLGALSTVSPNIVITPLYTNTPGAYNVQVE